MPNCFQLISKETGEPVNLRDVDDDLWRTIGGQEPDTKKWFLNWYNTIGLGLAVGHDWDKLKEIYKEDIEEDSMCAKTLTYLADKYDSSAWYSPR